MNNLERAQRAARLARMAGRDSWQLPSAADRAECAVLRAEYLAQARHYVDLWARECWARGHGKAPHHYYRATVFRTLESQIAAFGRVAFGPMRFKQSSRAQIESYLSHKAADAGIVHPLIFIEVTA